MIYLDNNATTQPSPAVIRAMCEVLESCWHNPSSIHRCGQVARQKVELARKDVADLIGAKPRQIIFTSSGTEAIDLVIRGLVEVKAATLASSSAATGPGAKPVVVTTPIEHGAIRELVHDLAKRGQIEARSLPMLPGGVVDAAALPGLLADAPRVACVSVMWANNETGVVQPIESIGRCCRDMGVTFHCDGTQWVGKMPTRVEGDAADAPHAAPIDVLTFSPHKFYGPKGIGMVWMRKGVRLPPQIHGSQELGRRGGTENVPGIVGAGVACREAREWLADPARRERQRAVRDRFERAVLAGVPGAIANAPSDPAQRVWNTSSIAFPRLEAEALLMLLSEMGLCASAGSACSSGSLEPSPVLLAMGLGRECAHGSLRFSISRETTENEVDQAVTMVVAAVERLRQSVSGLAGVKG